MYSQYDILFNSTMVTPKPSPKQQFREAGDRKRVLSPTGEWSALTAVHWLVRNEHYK
jgi:hypothetical protein